MVIYEIGLQSCAQKVQQICEQGNSIYSVGIWVYLLVDGVTVWEVIDPAVVCKRLTAAMTAAMLAVVCKRLTAAMTATMLAVVCKRLTAAMTATMLAVVCKRLTAAMTATMLAVVCKRLTAAMVWEVIDPAVVCKRLTAAMTAAMLAVAQANKQLMKNIQNQRHAAQKCKT